jgi:hypothetical protein
MGSHLSWRLHRDAYQEDCFLKVELVICDTLEAQQRAVALSCDDTKILRYTLKH